MKKLTVSVAVAALLAAGVAHAADKPATTTKPQAMNKPVKDWTCADYLAVDDQFRPKVVYEITGLTKNGKPETIIDIEGTERAVPEIEAVCRQDPSSSFLPKLKATLKAVEKDAKDALKKVEKKL